MIPRSTLAMLLNHGSNEVLATDTERRREGESGALSGVRNKEKFVITAVSFLRSSNWITSSPE